MNRAQLETHIKVGLKAKGVLILAASVGDTVMVHIENPHMDASKSLKFCRADIMDHGSAAYEIMRCAARQLTEHKPRGLYNRFKQGVGV